jgi:hypothetical protein
MPPLAMQLVLIRLLQRVASGVALLQGVLSHSARMPILQVELGPGDPQSALVGRRPPGPPVRLRAITGPVGASYRAAVTRVGSISVQDPAPFPQRGPVSC